MPSLTPLTRACTLHPLPFAAVVDLQVVTDGVSLPAGARLLLSDKQLKVWSLVSAAALARFQDQFPEFQPTARNLCKLAGGIIVPTRWSMLVHPHLREFIMQIDEFEVRNKGRARSSGRNDGAGCTRRHCTLDTQ